MATDIADLVGAAFVIGEPENIEMLRRQSLPVSQKRQQDFQAAEDRGEHRLAMWLRQGERGASSNAMSKRLFGLPQDAGSDHPYDPDDLRRCLLFLDAVDAHDKLVLMRDVSPEWGKLVDAWADIRQAFREESENGSCPRTYQLMQEALG